MPRDEASCYHEQIPRCASELSLLRRDDKNNIEPCSGGFAATEQGMCSPREPEVRDRVGIPQQSGDWLSCESKARDCFVIAKQSGGLLCHPERSEGYTSSVLHNTEERGIPLKFVNMKDYKFYIYITTNNSRNVFYTGVTNNLTQRLFEHWKNRGSLQTFAGRYNCFNLVYYEEFTYINNAIAREKQIKGWRREKKLDLIRAVNPSLRFLNVDIFGKWPPEDMARRY